MIKKESKNKLRLKRHTRSSIKGDANRPRLSIYRSNKTIYCQLIDDTKGHTLVSANTGELKLKNNLEAAQELGKLIAQKAINLKIEKIVFDRSGYLYFGRIKAFADSARQAGLQF